jgi:uncharacterized membrane protein
MNKLNQIWINLWSSFWFMPSLIVLVSIVFAVVLIEIDSTGSDQWLVRWPYLFGAKAEGARGMISTIAGSMMSVMGVTFSITLVALALASNQYTSRILRNFMNSRITQLAIGTFAGIFTYCLIVLRTIRSGDEGSFVPNLAVFFGFILALGGVLVFIFFIHHIAFSIQASSIIASVAHETIAAIDRLFPEELEHGHDEDENLAFQALAELNWRAIPSMKSGYIQSVDNAALMRVAQDRKTIVRMERGIGEFVVQNTALASLALKDPPDQETIAALQATFSISLHRAVEQDVAFGIRQIVYMALKALSPGVNDVTTAIMCVDYLTAILVRLAPRPIPLSSRYEKGELRVIAKGPSFESLLTESFDQIRANAESNVAIMSRMIHALQTLAGLTTGPHLRGALREQVQWIAELAGCTVESAHERARIDTMLACVHETLEAGHSVCPGEHDR